MSIAAWNPVLIYVGGDEDGRREQAQAILAAIADRHPVTDLGGETWRVFDFDTPTQEAAVAALEALLVEVAPGCETVFRVSWEE